MKNAPSSSLATRYDRDGFVVVPDLLSVEECEKFKNEARSVLKEHGSGSSVYVHVSVVNETYRALAEDPRIVKLLRPIMPHGIMFLSDKIVYKAPDKTFATPPHVDCFYWRNTRPKLSVWIPLDDATPENGTLTVVPGSHKHDWRMVDSKGKTGEFQYQIEDGNWQEGDVVTCGIKRGTAIVFSDRLVHGSTRNTAGTDRFAIINTYHTPGPDEAFDLDFPARKVIWSGK